MRGRILGAMAAQIMAQALTAWTLVLHLVRAPEISLLVVVGLLAALAVPFRHDGTLRDRATGNFGAGLLVAGFLWWEVLFGGLDFFFGGADAGFGVEILLMLVSTILFSLAGSLFWTLRESREV